MIRAERLQFYYMHLQTKEYRNKSRTSIAHNLRERASLVENKLIGKVTMVMIARNSRARKGEVKKKCVSILGEEEGNGATPSATFCTMCKRG